MNSLMQMLYNLSDMFSASFIKKSLAGAGVGVSTYTGTTIIMNKIFYDSTSMLYRGDSDVLALLGLGGVDTALSLIISACFTRATIASSHLFLTKL